jgi:hypothetical protein
LRLHCTVAGDDALLIAVEAVAPDALASADEATKPMEATDNVNASNFFMIFLPFFEKYPGATMTHTARLVGELPC